MARFRINQINSSQTQISEKPLFTINENLTQSSGLVRITNSLNGTLGYEVVVFRKRGESLDYFRTLRSNERISNVEAMFKEFTNYQVDLSLKSLKFSQRFVGENHPTGIEIDFIVEYKVDDSARLCHLLSSDPLGKIRDKMIWFFKERFASQNPAQTASALSSLRQSLLQDIQEFTQGFGIAISMVDLQSRLGEDIVQIEKKKREAERNIKFHEIDKDEAIKTSLLKTEKDQTIKRDVQILKVQDVKAEIAIQELREQAERDKKKKDTELELELARKQLEYEGLKRDVELIASTKEGLLNAGIKAVEKLVEDIDSASDLPEKIDQFNKAINKLRELFSPARPMIETTAMPISVQELPAPPVAALSDPETNVNNLLNEFFVETSDSIMENAQRQIFKTTLSDLKSQLGLGNRLDPDIIRVYWSKIEALLPEEKISEKAAKLKVQLRILLYPNQ